MIQHEDIPNLPPLLQEMVAAVGLAPVIQLVEFRAGRQLYIPADIPPGHELMARLGPVACRWLCGRLAGDVIVVPMARAALLAQRDREIRQRRANGELIQSLALRYGLHVRRIWQILAVEPAASPPETQSTLL